jgi:hypothetical protein
VNVAVGDRVKVGVKVAVGEGVRVGVGGLGVSVAVAVKVAVNVALGGMGVSVIDGVKVSGIGVAVKVALGGMGVSIATTSAADGGTSVEVRVGACVGGGRTAESCTVVTAVGAPREAAAGSVARTIAADVLFDRDRTIPNVRAQASTPTVAMATTTSFPISRRI